MGGLAAWLANKERNASMAQYMLFTGIGIAVVQGLVGLTLVIVLMAPSAARPGQNPLATPTLPQATNPVPPAGTGGISTGPSTPAVTQSPAASSTNPSPLTSAEQPPDFKAQEAKIDEVVGQLCTAFKAKDAEGALKYFQAEERDKYRKIFSQFPDLLPEIAAELEMAKINFLSFKSDQYSRTAEYLIRSDGQDFSIVFIDVEGQWMLKKF